MKKIKNLRVNEKVLNEVIESKSKNLNTIRKIESGTFPLVDEFEMAYFHNMKDFFKTNIFSRIVNRKQKTLNMN